MKQQSYRISAHQQGDFGSRINRSRPISFSYDRERLVGVTGDTLSSALLANGVTTFGFNIHTRQPQGFYSLLDHSTPHMVSLKRGNLFIPEPDPNDVGMREGLSVRSTNTWKHRLAGVAPFLKRFSGFDTLSSLPLSELPENFEHIHTRVDVLIIGGGLGGICAAELPAEAGLDVLLVEASPFLGGISDAYDGCVEGMPLEAWIKNQASRLEALNNVRIRPLMTVIHLSQTGEAIILERISATGLEKSSPDTVRARLWFVKARAVVLATGAYERNLVFQDNAAVGVVSACSARLLLRRYGIAVGHHVVFACSSDEGMRTALDFKKIGISIELLADLRLHPSGMLLNDVKSEGIRLAFGSAPSAVSLTRRGHGLDSIRLRNRLRDDTGPALEREVLCDTVVTSGGWQPNLHLARGIGADFTRDDETGCVTIGYYPAGFYSAGAASGVYNARDVIQDALKAGAETVAYLKQLAAPAYLYRDIPCTVVEDMPAEYIPPLVDDGAANRAFLNERRTITVQDITRYRDDRDAARTQAHGFYRDEESRFLKPVGLAVLAGLTPRSDTARCLHFTIAKGAVTCVRDGWKVVDCFTRGNETPEQAVAREVHTVASKFGLCPMDHSQLVSVNGRNAAAFLARFEVLPQKNNASCAPAFIVNGILVHVLRVSEHAVYCFALRGGADLHAALLHEKQISGADVVVLCEEERWGKLLLLGEPAPALIPEHFLAWPLALTGLPVSLLLCPVGEAKGYWDTVTASRQPLLGLKAFEQFLFENGDLTGEQFVYAHKAGGTLYGVLASDPHFHIPPGSHLFAGVKPDSSRKNPALTSRIGSVLASHYSHRHGRNLSLALLNTPSEAHSVYFRAQGDFWQARLVSARFDTEAHT